MAGRQEIKCIGPSYQLADRKSAVQRSVNLFMQQIEGLGEDKQVVLASAPGLTWFLHSIGATLRGSHMTEDTWYVVAGQTLYKLTQAGVYTAAGTLSTTDGYVDMVHGSNQLVLVDGPNGYTLNLVSNVFARITSAGWRGSYSVAELDGYFIFIAPDTEQFYISAIDDASTLDALDFSSADSSPDNLVTSRTRLHELNLMGTKGIEVWVDSGDPDFPFVRYNSTPIDVGVVGNRAAVVASDVLVWVGQTKAGRGYVYAMPGHQPQRISTRAVEQALARSTDLSACSMWTYHVEGSEFVGVNAPGLGTTWVYEMGTKQWHERAELVNGDWVPLRADQITFVVDSHYATAGQAIYKLDSESQMIGDDVLVRERTWPHLISPSLEPVSYRGVEIMCTTGAGGTITLELSNDGGSVWMPPLLRSLGAWGRRMQRIRWLGLGTAVDRVFRLRCTDPVPLIIHQGAVDA